MLAFASPNDEGSKTSFNGKLHPSFYLTLFKKFNVQAVVRLNHPLYDQNIFKNNNIQHKDLYFVDGSSPNDTILNDFLTFSESIQKAIAVHCTAGFGRAGTLICAYIMKH